MPLFYVVLVGFSGCMLGRHEGGGGLRSQKSNPRGSDNPSIMYDVHVAGPHSEQQHHTN